MIKLKDDVCEVNFVDKKKIASVRKSLKNDSIIYQLSETFKVLGDPSRVKILFALTKEELCVCDIANLLRTSESAVSHQLRVLRNTRLVKYRKQGKMAYYSIDDEHIRTLFDKGLEHVEE